MNPLYISVATAASAHTAFRAQLLGYAASVVGHEGEMCENIIKPCQAFTDASDLERYKLSMHELEHKGLHPLHAIMALGGWIGEMTRKYGGEAVIVSHDDARDWCLLVHTYLQYSQPEKRVPGQPLHPFGEYPIYIRSYALGKFRCTIPETEPLRLYQRLGVAPINLDFLPGQAQSQAKLFAALLRA